MTAGRSPFVATWIAMALAAGACAPNPSAGDGGADVESAVDVARTDVVPEVSADTGIDTLADARMDVADTADIVDASAADGSDATTEDVVDVVTSCATPLTYCRGECVDLTSDAHHCGTCATDCTLLPGAASTIACVSGRCDLANGCTTGRAHCSTIEAAGCETVTTDDPVNCGACGAVCPTPDRGRARCTDGACGIICVAGNHACGVSCAADTDPASCGTSCSPCVPPTHGTATCDGTACGFACDTGYHACGASCASNGDVATCGSSCSPCPAPPAHSTSTCDGTACDFRCDAGYHRCGGVCAIDTSIASCGTSCSPCSPPANGTATCDGASCGFTCTSGFHACGSRCASNTSPLSCGASCTDCPTRTNAFATCDGTTCGSTCNPGYHDCGGTCVDSATVATCGSRCSPCTAPANATPTCDGASCDFVCNAGYHRCGSSCVDVTNVAMCTASCTPCTAPANGTVSCDGVRCISSCNAGYVLAGSSCVLRPRLVAPLSFVTTTSRRPTFRWVPAAGSDGASIRLCRDRALTSSCTTFDVTGNLVAPVSDLGAGTWFWRATDRNAGVTGTATSATWSFRVGRRAAPVDTTVGSAFDANGDGYGDIAVGAYRSRELFVYLGGPGGVATTPVRTITGVTAQSLTSGDLDGDGYADLLVSGDGDAAVFLGSASGTMGIPAVDWTATTAPAVVVGDVDRDGFADVVIGPHVYNGSESGPSRVASADIGSTGGLGSWFAPGWDTNGDGYPDLAVYNGYWFNMFYGGPAGLSTMPDGNRSIQAPFGGAGDLDGDGYADIVGQGNYGALWLFRGGAAGPSPGRVATSSLMTYAGLIATSRAGDVDGDGYDEVIVSGGTEFDLFSRANLTRLGFRELGEEARSVSGGGDVDGDGFDDVVVGVQRSGRALVFRGSASGISAAPDVTLTATPDSSYGWVVLM